MSSYSTKRTQKVCICAELPLNCLLATQQAQCEPLYAISTLLEGCLLPDSSEAPRALRRPYPIRCRYLDLHVAFFLAALFRLRPSQRSFVVAAAMFMNSNSLPIALMQSLVITVPGLKWEEEDNKNAMLGRALTYLVLYSTLASCDFVVGF